MPKLKKTALEAALEEARAAVPSNTPATPSESAEAEPQDKMAKMHQLMLDLGRSSLDETNKSKPTH